MFHFMSLTLLLSLFTVIHAEEQVLGTARSYTLKKVETDDANRAKSESGKLPEEAQYTIELEGKGKINLYLVRDRLMHLPEAIVKDKEEGKFHTTEFTADDIAFYRDQGGQGTFACKKSTTAGEECELTAMLDFDDESCYIGFGASVADCGNKFSESIQLAEPRVDPIIPTPEFAYNDENGTASNPSTVPIHGSPGVTAANPSTVPTQIAQGELPSHPSFMPMQGSPGDTELNPSTQPTKSAPSETESHSSTPPTESAPGKTTNNPNTTPASDQIPMQDSAANGSRNAVPYNFQSGFKTVEVSYMVDARFSYLFYQRNNFDVQAAQAEMVVFITLLTNELNVYYSTLAIQSQQSLNILLYPVQVILPGYGNDFAWSTNYNDGTYLYATNDFDSVLEHTINDFGYFTKQYDYVFVLTGFPLINGQSRQRLISSRKRYTVAEYTSWNIGRILSHELGHARYACLLDGDFTYEQFMSAYCQGWLGSQLTSLDKQCQRATYNIYSRACDKMTAKACYQPYQVRCRDVNERCSYRLKYVWNGTPCGRNKVCYRGSCVPKFAICPTEIYVPCSCCIYRGKKLKKCCKKGKQALGQDCYCCGSHKNVFPPGDWTGKVY